MHSKWFGVVFPRIGTFILPICIDEGVKLDHSVFLSGGAGEEWAKCQQRHLSDATLVVGSLLSLWTCLA